MNWNMADMEGKPMTDIVVRLRGGLRGMWPALSEAADEIERLRTEVAKLRAALEEISLCVPDKAWEVALDALNPKLDRRAAARIRELEDRLGEQDAKP